MANPSHPGRGFVGNFATRRKDFVTKAATQLGIDILWDDRPFDRDDPNVGSVWVSPPDLYMGDFYAAYYKLVDAGERSDGLEDRYWEP